MEKRFGLRRTENAGYARTARPSMNLEAMVFWAVVLTALPGLAYHYGFEAGFEKARSVPAKCSDRSLEGKALSGVSYDAGTRQTTCQYIQQTYGRAKWLQKL